MGGGGGRYSTKLAGERTSADIPHPNLVLVFGLLFESAGSSLKKKKEADSKTTILVLDENKG
jgi:hypothetical protein